MGGGARGAAFLHARMPQYIPCLQSLAAVSAELGHIEEARAAVAAMLYQTPGLTCRTSASGHSFVILRCSNITAAASAPAACPRADTGIPRLSATPMSTSEPIFDADSRPPLHTRTERPDSFCGSTAALAFDADDVR